MSDSLIRFDINCKEQCQILVGSEKPIWKINKHKQA
jgi:hypothetical protein